MLPRIVGSQMTSNEQAAEPEAAVQPPAKDFSVSEAFKALPKGARHRALETLVRELDPYDLRELQTIVGARTLQYDIVGCLPVELVAMVFTYLDISTPYRLQSVSKRWYHQLRSPKVLAPALHSWNGSTLKGFDYEQCVYHAQNIHRFRTGTYIKVCTIPTDQFDCPFAPAKLVNGLLIGVSGERVVRAYNLPNGQQFTAHGDARETISSIAASEELIAFATSLNICYVHEISSAKKGRFRLSSKILSLACRRRTVFCIIASQGGLEVYIWNFDPQKGKSFTIGYDHPIFMNQDQSCSNRRFELFPNQELQSLGVMTTSCCGEAICEMCRRMSCDPGDSHCPPAQILYGRFTFEGLTCAFSQQLLPDFVSLRLSSVKPTSNCGGFSVIFKARMPGNQYHQEIALQFEERLGTFVPPGAPESSGKLWISPKISGLVVSWWNDSFYALRPDDTRRHCGDLITLVHLGTSDNPKCRLLLEDQLLGETSLRSNKDDNLLVDGKFAVVLCSTATDQIRVVRFEAREE